MKPIKNILKKIFPVPFLKEAFLIYNKIRISTVDKLIFPELKINPEQFKIYRKGYPFRELEISIDDLKDEKVKTYMQSWHDWTQEEFLLVFHGKCWIEPEYGWGIVYPNKLIYYSLGVSRTWFQKKPNLLKLWKKKETTYYPQVISLRDSGEENYFHFYNDVLTKLFFARQHIGSLSDIPVLVAKKLWDKEYFQFYLKHSSFLQSMTWIVQDKQYILTDAVIFTKPLTHRKDLWTEVFSPFVLNNHRSAKQKIFLTRSKARLRFIENSQEIEDICREHGFTIIDTDNLSLEKQIEIFRDTSLLIGIHGAGLTNMAFRSEDCHVLELFPPPDQGYLPYHYILLAKMLHFHYDAIIGSSGKIRYSGGFYLPPEEFRKAISLFAR